MLAWIESGLLVSDNPAAGGIVFRLDPATGKRDIWADIEPQDPAGIMTLNHNTLVVTPDGGSYGYGWHRATSDLSLGGRAREYRRYSQLAALLYRRRSPRAVDHRRFRPIRTQVERELSPSAPVASSARCAPGGGSD